VIGDVAGGCAQRRLQRLIDRHFAARITPGEESALRAHLPGCDACRAHYSRHLLYAKLVRDRPGLEERLAVGLGVSLLPAAPASRHLPARRSWMLAAAAAATCVALLVHGRIGRAPESEFGVRGPASNVSVPGPALEIYRVTEDRSTAASEGWMSARGELAFAYRNPTGFARLMVFGVDDRGDIYWFHPAWTEPSQDPVAIAVAAGEGPFELPEAIRHEIRGNRLRIVALFTNAALSVRAVEEGWRSARPDPAGSVRFETSLEVRP
jgi:hypothetical protein